MNELQYKMNNLYSVQLSDIVITNLTGVLRLDLLADLENDSS